MITLTRYTRRAGALTKAYGLSDDGELIKHPLPTPAPNTAVRVSVANVVELEATLSALTTNQAVGYGLIDASQITTQTRQNEVARARDGKNCYWGDGAGVLMLDIDPDHIEGEPPTPDDLWEILCQAEPALNAAPALQRPSSSSYIYTSAGVQLTGLRGQRVYIVVADASQIPTIGRVIYERLWLLGYGSIMISTAGSMLERSLIDAAVWQPERLDFAAGAMLLGDLEQRFPLPIFRNQDAQPLDPALIKPLSAIEDGYYRAMIDEAKRVKRAEALAVRSARIKEKAPVMAKAAGVTIDAAERSLSAAMSGEPLPPDFVLYSQSGASVTVSELLNNPNRWNEQRFHDPVDPAYNNDGRIAVAYLTESRPKIYSHAHGGITYPLQRERVQRPTLPADAEITLSGGEIITAADITQNRHKFNGKIGQYGDIEITINTGSKDDSKWFIYDRADSERQWAIEPIYPAYSALPDPATETISKYEVRERVCQILNRDTGNTAVIAMQQGAGKTAAISEFLSGLKPQQELLSVELPVRVLILTPTIKLGLQIQQQISRDTSMATAVLMGRERDCNGGVATDTGLEPLCTRAPVMKALEERYGYAHGQIKKIACVDGSGDGFECCPHYRGCAYIEQRRQAAQAQVVIAPHEAALTQAGITVGEFDHVVVDELPQMHKLISVDEAELDLLYSKDVAAVIRQYISDLYIAESEEAIETIEHWLASKLPPELTHASPSLTDKEIAHSINHDLADFEPAKPRALAVARLIRDCLKSDENRDYLAITDNFYNTEVKTKLIWKKGLKRFKVMGGAKYTILDATARQYRYVAMFGADMEFHKLHLADANGARVYQCVDTPYPQKAFSKAGEIGRVALMAQLTDSAVICQKEQEQALNELGMSNTGHFGDLRGMNHLASEHSLMIVGRKLPRVSHAELIASCYWPDIEVTGQQERQAAVIEAKDGSRRTVILESHSDPRVAGEIATIRDDEVAQAERLRVVWGDPDRQIILLNNVPVPYLQPDSFIELDALPTIEAGKVVELTGLTDCILPYKHTLIEAMPDRSQSAAEKEVKRLQQGVRRWIDGTRGQTPIIYSSYRRLSLREWKPIGERNPSTCITIGEIPDDELTAHITATIGKPVEIRKSEIVIEGRYTPPPKVDAPPADMVRMVRPETDSEWIALQRACKRELMLDGATIYAQPPAMMDATIADFVPQRLPADPELAELVHGQTVEIVSYWVDQLAQWRSMVALE